MSFLGNSLLQKWARSEDGATAVEYGLILAGIALAVSGAIFGFGDKVVGMFQDIVDYLNS